MAPAAQPPLDRLEVRLPRVAAAGARALGRMPAPVRRRALASAFDRARDAFNRGDLEALFALFADDVEYVPPAPLHYGAPIAGKANVVRFWRDVLDRFDESSIENLSIEETGRSRFVRRARLSHRGAAGGLDYEIRQTTELRGGRVVRQVNELGGDSRSGAAPQSRPAR